MASLRLVFVVGEASGDTLAAAMIDGLEAAGYDVESSGMGGVQMQARGLVSLEPIDSLTIIGFMEAFKAMPRLNRLADRLIDHIFESRPDAVITVDSKGFNLRFARRLRQRMKASASFTAPAIHIVAPKVWAWRSWRAKTVAKSVDRLLCLYPFEVPYFTAHGLDTVAVGHPAAEQERPDYDAARQQLGIAPDDKMLVLLPGSRRREVLRLAPDMVAAAAMLKEKVSGLKVFLPVADTAAEHIAPLIMGEKIITPVSRDDLDLVLAGGDFGLICSGTVSLEAALSGLPGHVYYRLDMLSEVIGRLLVNRDRIVLPNVIAGREIYGFSFGRDFTASSMAEVAMRGLMRGRDGAMARDATSLSQTLGTGGGFRRAAAAAIIDKIESRI